MARPGLVPVSTAVAVDPVARLVARLRRRLIGNRAVRDATLGLWAGSTLFGGLWLAQRLTGAVPAGAILALAMGLLAVWVILAGSRAALPEAQVARLADRHSNADSLLLSAWDLLRRDATAQHPAAGLVLARAQAQLPTWAARLDAEFPRPALSGLGLAAVACSVAALALLSAPRVGSTVPASAAPDAWRGVETPLLATQPDTAEPAEAESDKARANTALAQAAQQPPPVRRTAGADPVTIAHDGQAASKNDMVQHRVQQPGNARDDLAAFKDQVERSARETAKDSTTRLAANRAGDGQNGAESAPPGTAAMLNARFQDFQRRGPATVTAAAGEPESSLNGHEGETGATPLDGSRLDATGKPADLPAYLDSHPALQSYIAAFLRQAQADPPP